MREAKEEFELKLVFMFKDPTKKKCGREKVLLISPSVKLLFCLK